MLIRLEAQAVTTADLGQEHGILARLQFSLILSLIDLLVDQCCSRMLLLLLLLLMMMMMMMMMMTMMTMMLWCWW